MFLGEWHSQVCGLKTLRFRLLCGVESGECPQCREATRRLFKGVGNICLCRQRAAKLLVQGQFWSVSPQVLAVSWICGQGKGGLQGGSQVSSLSHKGDSDA